MHVTFDYQIFSSQVQGGISRYFIELARHMSTFDHCDVEILAPLFVTDNLRDTDRRLLARPAWYDQLAPLAASLGSTLQLKAREASWRRCVNQRLSRRYLQGREPDVFHETFFEPDPMPLASAKRVLTVQDMIDERILLQAGRTSQAFVDIKRAAVLRADHVLCSSHRTRIDLLNLVPLLEARTTVVHLGCRSLAEWPADSGSATSRPPYMLFVGNRDTYKNFDGVLRAFAGSRRLLDAVQLVAFGGGPLTMAERARAQELGIPSERLVHLDGGDQILADLYRHAAVCVYPSFYEGFGLIPLEAMTLGCPVVTTHGGSLEEVVVDAGEIVDPAAPESIMTGLEHVVFDSTRRADLVARGAAHASTFTWERCARETYAAYQGLFA